MVIFFVAGNSCGSGETGTQINPDLVAAGVETAVTFTLPYAIQESVTADPKPWGAVSAGIGDGLLPLLRSENVQIEDLNAYFELLAENPGITQAQMDQIQSVINLALSFIPEIEPKGNFEKWVIPILIAAFSAMKSVIDSELSQNQIQARNYAPELPAKSVKPASVTIAGP
jgi:hypothetical protein